MRWFIFPFLIAQSAASEAMDVYSTAHEIFDQMPIVEIIANMHEHCGSAGNTNPHIGYCTSENVIYVSEAFDTRPAAGYEMAHVLGHAIQVQHGVADIALNAIRTRRDEEAVLRGLVTRQVECVAGVLMALAELEKFTVSDYFHREPFTNAHWGRRPLNAGPQVSIGLEARSDWVEIGFQAADFSVCTVGEMSADLIVQAAR